MKLTNLISFIVTIMGMVAFFLCGLIGCARVKDLRKEGSNVIS
jgi:hypothetical protein